MFIDLKNKTSTQIIEIFEALDAKEGEVIEAEVLESDIERFGYKAFVDLAQLFFMKMLTPAKKDEKSVVLKFYKLKKELSFHKSKENSTEKYGVESQFFQIDKTLQFSFLYHYRQALNFADIKNRKRVLNIGINRGDEFKTIKEMLPYEVFKNKEFVGIDYSSSAIDYAKRDFSDSNVEFICHDVNELKQLNLGRFDLIISIGTLQSSSINFNETFMKIYQEYLNKGGTMVLGFPNCRWIDGEMIYGAKPANYNFSELGVVLQDIIFCKKYLQQKKYRVIVSGKDYVFLSAKKIITK